MPTIIAAHSVSYVLPDGRALFTNLTFTLDNKLTALVGANGVGKTTLARVCAGQLQASSGSIHRHDVVGLFAQRAAAPHVSVGEYLADRYEWSPCGERLLQDIDLSVACDALSGGQWTRVRLSAALNHGFLILDEPTNNLDREARGAVGDFLHNHTHGALLISHDRECLLWCTEVLELSNRGLMKFGGDWTAYIEFKNQERQRLHAAVDHAKRERDAVLAARNEQLLRQEKRNRHGAAAAARGGTPKIVLGARKRRAQASTGKLDSTSMRRTNAVISEARSALAELKIDPVMYADVIGSALPAQKLIARAAGFNICRNRWIFSSDLDFVWRGNLRIALQGGNGTGKSTLLKALHGENFAMRGELTRGELSTLYLDQQCSLLDDTQSILANVRAVSSASDSEIRNALARFLFAGEQVFQPVAALSGGERLRAALARCFLSTQQPQLLLLDEPTNNLDLANIEFLENVLRAFQGAMVIVSHDPVFLERCGITQIFDLQSGRES